MSGLYENPPRCHAGWDGDNSHCVMRISIGHTIERSKKMKIAKVSPVLLMYVISEEDENLTEDAARDSLTPCWTITVFWISGLMFALSGTTITM